jgi:hypothetical protein
MPDGVRTKLVPIPPQLPQMLTRAEAICNIGGNELHTHIRVHDEVLEFTSESERGVVADSTPLPGHPNVEARVKVSYMRPPCRWAEQILFSERCVLMGAGDTIHVTSGRHRRQSPA